jgi:hypothetical protein
MTAKAQIFLAHASEDKDEVRELYAKLARRGFKPWLDEVDLLPGQNWQAEIAKAIRESDIFIACLSRLSVKKQGYVQREFRSALATYAEKPPGSIYLIPLKLDDCEIPDFQFPQLGVGLRDIQWLDYWRPEGFERLARAIEASREQHPGAQKAPSMSSASFFSAPEARTGRTITGMSGSAHLARRIAAGVAGAFGLLMLFLSVVDAGVAGISEGGLLIGAVCLGVAFALWPRGS